MAIIYINKMSSEEVGVKRNSLTIRGIAGLENIGNSCYMNSILQCLNNIPIFSAYIRNESLQKLEYIFSKRFRDNKEEYSERQIEELCEKTITCQLQKLFDNMWVIKSDGVNLYFPIISGSFIRSNLKDVIDTVGPFFSGMKQHDSQEFLNFILDQVHMDTGINVRLEVFMQPKVNNYKKAYMTYKEIQNNDKYTIEEKAQAVECYKQYKMENIDVCTVFKSYNYWVKYIQNNKYSIINELFFGLFHSVITCTTCGAKRNSFTPFTTMAIPIPNHSSEIELVDCLNKFSELETLSESNMYTCKQCKEKRIVTKKMTIWEPPECIILHLERFKTENTHIIEKINTLVKFPITGLKLDMCYDSLHPINDRVYDLYAVSNHSGSPSGGHYTAYAKNCENNNWYKFNDSTVQPIPDEHVSSEIITPQAYILFYFRRL